MLKPMGHRLVMGVSSSSWGYPKLAGWFLWTGKSHHSKWMMTGGSPISGNHHIKGLVEGNVYRRNSPIMGNLCGNSEIFPNQSIEYTAACSSTCQVPPQHWQLATIRVETWKLATTVHGGQAEGSTPMIDIYIYTYASIWVKIGYLNNWLVNILRIDLPIGLFLPTSSTRSASGSQRWRWQRRRPKDQRPKNQREALSVFFTEETVISIETSHVNHLVNITWYYNYMSDDI